MVLEKHQYMSLFIMKEINIYDNTNRFKHVAYICDGIIRWNRDIIPKWSINILGKS